MTKKFWGTKHGAFVSMKGDRRIADIVLADNGEWHVVKVATPRTPKPPWDAPANVMTLWVIEQLDAEKWPLLEALVAEVNAEKKQGSLAEGIEQAERHGDISLLREGLPLLANNPLQEQQLELIASYLRPPPRPGRGKHFEKENRVANAVATIKRIRALWRQHYNKKNRPNHLVSAQTIAEEIHNVTIPKRY